MNKKDYLKPELSTEEMELTNLCAVSQQGEGEGGDPDAKDDDFEEWDFVWGE